MTSVGRVAGTSCLVLVMVTGAYVTADVYDMVPGLLTTRAADPPPAPFPQAPGARPAPEQTAVAEDFSTSVKPITNLEPIEEALEEFLEKEDWIGTSVGVYLVDASTGEPLVSHAADSLFEPASTAKTLTAIASLERLGGNTTLPTTVIRESNEQIILIGGGDTLLGPGDSDPSAVSGRAGLGDLAEQVSEVLLSDGVTEVTLRLDDYLFGTPLVHADWPNQAVNAGYAAPVTPLAVHGARIGVGAYAPRELDPSLHAARLFADALEEHGVSVEGTIRRGETEATNVIGQVESAPVWEIVDYFMRTSDNTVSDVMCRLVAVDAGLPGTFNGGASAVLQTVDALGIDTAGARLSDCSGLAEGSVMRPNQLVESAMYVHDADGYSLATTLTGMPVSGMTGTLASRFEEGHSTGLIRAKTGSLPETVSLSGSLLTIEGQEVMFAVMIDDIPEGESWSARASLDTFLRAVVACGCSSDE